VQIKKKKIQPKKTNQAKEFLSKEHHDSNMVVAVRVRPLNGRERDNKDYDILNI
jgi:hypothetical protein